MAFELPKRVKKPDGSERKVGFELEFGNVPIETTVVLIQNLYGGEIKQHSRFYQKVVNTSLGDFSIEIDARLLTEKAYLKPLQMLNIDISKVRLGQSNLEQELEKLLEGVLSFVVPFEIGTPAVPISRLHELERLRESLFLHQAKGTKAFPTNIFATHINAEVPDEEAQTLLNYLRALLLIYPWMLRAAEVDLARRLSPFIDPFPEAYADLILRMGYNPTMEQLIDDYHAYNPDRNRPLDMYPLFAYLRKEQVALFPDIGKLSARPTFHYRLPNSQIEEEDWSLEKVWNNWVMIENLASDREKIQELCKQYLDLKRETHIGFGSKWAKQSEQWL